MAIIVRNRGGLDNHFQRILGCWAFWWAHGQGQRRLYNSLLALHGWRGHWAHLQQAGHHAEVQAHGHSRLQHHRWPIPIHREMLRGLSCTANICEGLLDRPGQSRGNVWGRREWYYLLWRLLRLCLPLWEVWLSLCARRQLSSVIKRRLSNEWDNWGQWVRVCAH